MLQFLAVLGIGFLVGVFNGAAGGASVLSFPVLVATGLNPISATMTNALGVFPANIFALIGKWDRVKEIVREHRKVLFASCLGALFGALALTFVPEKRFKEAVPFLLLIASFSLLVKVKPALTAFEKRVEVGLMAAIGLYCGYFGPGQGVMVIAVLARDAGRSVVALNMSKNVIVAIVSLVSNVIFIASGKIHWGIALTLFISSSIGGYIGGRIVGKISKNIYRVIIFAVGFSSSLWFFYVYLIR
jgi:uncharacterized membrane protein YfcA